MTEDSPMTLAEFSRDVLNLPCGQYRHYKGGMYRVVGIGRDTREPDQVVVVYVAEGDLQLTGTMHSLWVRPVEEFNGWVYGDKSDPEYGFERYEGDSGAVRRFEYVPSANRSAVS